MRALSGLVVAIALLTAPVASAAAAGLQVTSPAFAAGGAIPARYSAYGDNAVPPVRWSPVTGAKSYALALWDPDATDAHPFVHWVVWNIKSSDHSLSGGAPAGAVQGQNSLGRNAYFGPRPPSGTHHYHFEVFALDSALRMSADSDFAKLTAAMKGHVLAHGELMATYTR